MCESAYTGVAVDWMQGEEKQDPKRGDDTSKMSNMHQDGRWLGYNYQFDQ